MARKVTFADLLAIAQRVGVEVESAPSSHRGKKGSMGEVAGITRHHTGTGASFRPVDDYPDFNVVKEGRAGLLNSLSAFGIGRWRKIYVFSEYLSWHTGEWSWAGIRDGNGHFLGIEAAGVGDWTPFQRQVYPRLCASILLFIGEGTDMMPRHADGALPKGRKTDAANLWATFTDEVRYFMAHPAEINVNSTEPEAEEILMDVASNKFVAAPDAPNVVWLTNGLVRRLMQAGEPETQVQLGMAEAHQPAGTGKDGKPVPEQLVAQIPAWMINRIPILEGSGWLPDQGVYRFADDISAASITAIVTNVVKAVGTVELDEGQINRLVDGVVAALPPVTGGNPATAAEIAAAVRAELHEALA